MTQTKQHCSTPDQFLTFLRGQLSDREEAELQQHLNDCVSCRERLDSAVADTSVWNEAREFLGHGALHASSQGFSDEHEEANQGSQRIRQVLDALGPTDDPDALGRIGGYEVTGVVGAGGMGVVLKAHDRSLDRIVAIKVMSPHLASSGSARKRFAREAKAAAAVLHPNVIAIHSVASEDPNPYLVMPFVRGASLQKRIDSQGPLPLKDTLRIGAQIAAGLAAAHEQGLVHRDIKPANILLEEGVERVTITDFGLARAVDDASMTCSGVIAGTPQYMSPEQARGEPIDARSDLFSLGGVLYAMCTGRSPFRAETTYGVLHRIANDNPTPVCEVNSDVPMWLGHVIQRLMAKRPEDRFESSAQVAELLEGCLAHVQQPAAMPLPEAVAALAPRITRRPPIGKFIAAAAGAFALLVAGILIVLELDKGTLTIENNSDSDIPIRIMQGKETVDRFTLTHDGIKTRLRAGNYSIEVDSPDTHYEIVGDNVKLMRGSEWIASATVSNRNIGSAGMLKDPPTAQLNIKYEMPGAEDETRIFVERVDSEFYAKHGRRDEYGKDEQGGVRFSRLKNGDSLTMRDLPVGKFQVARYRLVDIVREGTSTTQKSVILDNQWIELAEQETRSISLTRPAGQPISGRVVIPEDSHINTLVVHVCSENARSSGSLNHQDVRLFDALNADSDGKFKTEPLPPGRYKVIVEAYANHSPVVSGEIAPSWDGAEQVAVIESNEPAAVEVTLRKSDVDGRHKDQIASNIVLELRKLYPELQGLSLDMTEPQFLDIVKQQEWTTQKIVDGESFQYRIALGDGRTLVVFLDKDGKCSDIQCVRDGESKRLQIREATVVEATPDSSQQSVESKVVEFFGIRLKLDPAQPAVLTEDDIMTVESVTDPNNPKASQIVLTLTPEAGDRFLIATTRLSSQPNPGYLVIEFDGIVLSAPRVIDKIGRKVSITASKQDDIDKLVGAIRDSILPRGADAQTKGPSDATVQLATAPPTIVTESKAPAIDHRNARSVVEAYLGSALAGDVATATSLAKNSPADPKRIQELPEFLNIQRLKIETVYVNDLAKPTQALATSVAVKLDEEHKNPDGQRDGFLVFRLEFTDDKWLVIDIDFETESGAEKELNRFLKANSHSIGIPPQSQSLTQ